MSTCTSARTRSWPPTSYERVVRGRCREARTEGQDLAQGVAHPRHVEGPDAGLRARRPRTAKSDRMSPTPWLVGAEGAGRRAIMHRPVGYSEDIEPVMKFIEDSAGGGVLEAILAKPRERGLVKKIL